MASEPTDETAGDLLGDIGSRKLEIQAGDIPFATDGIHDVPTIYADVIRGTAIMSGVAKLNLVEFKMDAQDDQMKAKHVATIVVPASQIPAWAEYLSKLMSKSEDGADGA